MIWARRPQSTRVASICHELWVERHSTVPSHLAICTKCEAFGRLAGVAEDRAETWVRVHFRGCGHEWVIDDASW